MSLCFSFQTHSLFGGRTRRRRQAGEFQSLQGFVVLAENARRLFLESYQRNVQRKGVPRTETNSGGHPGMRATASANALQNRQYRRRSPGVFFLSSRASAPARGPGPILRSPSMGRRVWIPAFAGMTCLCARQPQTNAAVIPAKRATASASRDPVTPAGAIRTDRGYWIPAFAGMTGVCVIPPR